jgi:hypothetical protein
MIHIKKFIDKISAMESKQNKDVVIPMLEAKGLRDEVSKLLADLYQLKSEKGNKEEIINVEITGGSFK